MTETERKALALVNEVLAELEGNWTPRTKPFGHEAFKALCRAIEQHEAFRREVSDAIDSSVLTPETEAHLARFIIAKPVDPLVEALNDMKDGRAGGTTESYAACLRNALAARGLEIREVQS